MWLARLGPLVLVLALAAALPPTVPAATVAERAPLRFDDLYAMPSEPQISPDGRQIAFVVHANDVAAGKTAVAAMARA